MMTTVYIMHLMFYSSVYVCLRTLMKNKQKHVTIKQVYHLLTESNNINRIKIRAPGYLLLKDTFSYSYY